MRTMLALAATLVLLVPLPAGAETAPLTLDRVAKAMGATDLASIEYTGTGLSFAVGQSTAPGQPWPQFTMKSYTRSVNYVTASLREDAIRQRADSRPRGGGLPALGEARQIQVVSGDHAWNVAGDAAVPAPVALAERQFQLWSTPHGIVKAAMANRGTVRGRAIAFTVPGRFAAKAFVDAHDMIERVEARLPNPVLGDIPVVVTYADYRDFGGVKFPMQIRQSAGGFPALDVTVSEVRPNAPVDITVPDAVRQATNPYAKVTSEKVADGVWFLSGGSHNSAVIEMKDHAIVVESPLNDDRAVAVIAEAKKVAGGKRIRYVVVSHHHFDHAGGVRAIAADGAIVITHDVSRAFFERALAARATIAPDLMTRSGRKPKVDGVADRRVLTDGTRTVEIHHIAGNLHADDLLLVYLPKEKLVVEADVYTPAPPSSVVNPNTVNLADTFKRLSLDVEQLLPLHGRIVPVAELEKAIGHEH